MKLPIRVDPTLSPCVALLCALSLAACEGSEDGGRDSGRKSDASDNAGEDDTGGSGSSDNAGRRDDGGRAGDAGNSPSEAGAQSDAASEGAGRDASTSDAGRDASMDGATRDAGGGANARRSEVCGSTTSFPDPLPAMNQRQAQPVGSATFGFIEGPVWVASQGVLLFSDMDFGGGDAMGPPSRIRRLKPPATFDEFTGSSNSNGLALAPDGNVLAATHDNQALSRFNIDSATRTPIKVLYQGKHFNSPNDLTVRSDGTVYFTDPDWQLGSRTSEIGSQGVYRVRGPIDVSGDNAAELMDGTLTKPNGVALSPDEQTLYVGSQGNEIWKYPVNADGSLGMRSKFVDVNGSSDGMAVDCAGNLYVASNTVKVFAPGGAKLGEISVGGTPSNAAFGGADRKTLYITAGDKLYSIGLNVPGFPY
jgi:gluconolactonase